MGSAHHQAVQSGNWAFLLSTEHPYQAVSTIGHHQLPMCRGQWAPEGIRRQWTLSIPRRHWVPLGSGHHCVVSSGHQWVPPGSRHHPAAGTTRHHWAAGTTRGQWAPGILTSIGHHHAVDSRHYRAPVGITRHQQTVAPDFRGGKC